MCVGAFETSISKVQGEDVLTFLWSLKKKKKDAWTTKNVRNLHNNTGHIYNRGSGLNLFNTEFAF